MSSVSDRDVRLRALNPEQSFVVQAPAGSGKTELLIQRYLRLLATVSEPEQVIAITFTRKAAAEMRSRVLAALHAAAESIVELSPHKQLTRDLARAVLASDTERDWNIRADSQRMRIGTLDSFNTSLAVHLPLLSGGAAGSAIKEDAAVLYAEAARRTVESIWQEGDSNDSRAAVLNELDFDTAAAERLIAGLLGTREQWITWLLDIDNAIAESDAAITSLQTSLVSQIDSLIASETLDSLNALTRHANSHGSEGTQRATAGISATDAASQRRAIAGLFLTKDGDWRKRFTKTEGFAASFAEQKSQLQAILATLTENPDLAAMLHSLRQLPDAGNGESDRALAEAISNVLRHAVAELRLLFARRRVVDFTELGLAARNALGQVDAPSDLLLALDHRIQHILVDEFQDTSVAQHDLLVTLTAGWMPDDGRTLFLVGDPMQSIYRFRHADMSLFLAARQFGIGNIVCEPLELAVNFRSAPAIVDWVNAAFSQCFPERDDLFQGVAAFKPGVAACESEPGDIIQAHALPSIELADEHAVVVQIIKNERAVHRESRIAILVRSRSHLAGFQALLQDHGWQARAVEIDAPYSSQLTQDLIGIARALTHFGDRIAWLAQLRAPWCGLRWSELEALTGDAPQLTVWEIVHDEDRLSRLDIDSIERVVALRQIFVNAIQRRAELPFAEWLYEVWQALDGPATLGGNNDETQIDELFALFEQAAADQDIPDVADLENFFRQPIRQASRSDADIEIMTIHRAKGLEFDCVILPGLARRPRGDDRRLLEWLDGFDATGQRNRIIAPLRRSESAAVDWIRARNRERGRAEIARLLYVAATRARRRLHLVWGLEAEAAPPDASLLKPVWPLLSATPATQLQVRMAVDDDAIVVPLRRRTAPLEVPELVTPETDSVDSPLSDAYSWTSGTAASVGIVVHDWLQKLCEQPEQKWDAAWLEESQQLFVTQLELLGVPPGELDESADNVARALRGVMNDPRGQWITEAHEAAQSEVMLSAIVHDQVVHQRLDRTFVEDGIRWIVDYKTSVCNVADIDAFLDAEVERYQPQLERYAQFMMQRDARPIRLGLYFPMLPAFRDWSAGN